jgi:ABC-type nitrate/sulfonate/bicarbonate transport system substrate-binding protein
LFEGNIDFISGNHITPYALVAKHKPIVCIASPSNSVRDTLVSRARIGDLSELRGQKIADLALEGRIAGFNHLRGNHMMYLLRAGLRLDEVKWVDIGEDMSPETRKVQFDTLQSGRADATFVARNARPFEEAGFHVLELDALPMINGPTVTTSTVALKRKDRLGERLVKAVVMTIHFARTHRDETERILEGLRRREPEASSARTDRLARMPIRPYPLPQAVLNAYELCLMKAPEAKDVSPLALWDVHYLRDLDDSGFIDTLSSGAGSAGSE